MKLLKCCFILGLISIGATNGFDLFPKDKVLYYQYNGTVQIDAFPYDKDVETIEPNTWSISGRLTLQRHDDDYIAALFTPHDVIATKLPSLENPFKLLLTNGIVTSIQFLKDEPIWAANIKRAIASALQVHGEEPGAFVISEGGLNGFCNTDYYISANDENGWELTVQKTPELASCFPFVNGVHNIKSNLQPVGCQNKDLNIEDNVLVGIESQYILNVRSKDNNEIKYRLTEGTVKSRSSVHTFETNGESHSILSTLNLKYDSEGEILDRIDLTRDLIPRRTNLDYIAYEYSISAFDDIDVAEKLLNKLVDTLETRNVDFNYPYDDTAAEIFRIVGLLDEKSLVKLYKKFDIGTSYRQETAKNLFLEILPRIGSKASVMLIKDLIVNKNVKPTTAIQLLVTMPFYITDLSFEVVSLCEVFLSLGPDRPDVKDAAVLSYATIIFKTYSAHQLTPNQFDRYVKRYFDLFVDAIDYEQKMLYIQALANLQLGNVAQYLAPIIKDSKQSTDLRYLAMWATMPTAHTRSEQSYEIFWPIFERKTNPLELRISAFTVLLTSNPSPGRLLSLHRIITQETSQHLLNFYRTTIISMSESTYPCHNKLKRTLSYMLRYIPKKQPPTRFWVTGNYIVDYKDTYYGNAGLVQAMFIGDEMTDTPYIGFFKLVTEALGRITDHMGVHIKARGVSDSLLNLIVRNVPVDNIHKLRSILDAMDLNTVLKTPLHMELVLQFEGKTVLAYYLNNTTIRGLSKNHINSIFSDDSHINMQAIRWPFMTKHSLPTALGTPIALTIQSTVLNAFRGNVTQITSLSSVSSEIDIRQYTYSALSSSTYNPFINLEHSIRREQGLIIYVPLHNQIGIDILYRTARLSFSRPADLVSGYSMKSRIISRTEGTHNGEHFVKERSFFSPTNTTNSIPFQVPLVDLGLDLNIVSNEASFDNLMALYSAIDIQKNIAILDDIEMGQKLLNCISSAHLGSIHFGSDKHFQVVLNNHNPSITEFTMKMTDKKVDITMEHKRYIYSQPSYIWNLNIKNIESDQIGNRFRITFKRLDQTEESNDDGNFILPFNVPVAIVQQYLDYFYTRLNYVIAFPEDERKPIEVSPLPDTTIVMPIPPIEIPGRPYLDKINFPKVLTVDNENLHFLEQLSDNFLQYEDKELQEFTLQHIIPMQMLKDRVSDKISKIQRLIQTGKIDGLTEPIHEDVFLIELLNWFNTTFFIWVDVECKVCLKNGNKTFRIEDDTRVEYIDCCGEQTSLYHYTDVAQLLKSRQGQSQEFASCFTFMCRCLGYNVRYVHSNSNHAWTEIFLPSQNQWIHFDPSKNIFNAPFVYEHYFKTKITYIVAVSHDDIQNVTRRYTIHYDKSLTARTQFSETELLKAIKKIRTKRQQNLSKEQKSVLKVRNAAELALFKVSREANEDENVGRSSGSPAWKLCRNENNVCNGYVFELNDIEIKLKQFALRYSCIRDVYERYNYITETVLEQHKTWQKCLYECENVFYKKENDWRKVYLCRTQECNYGRVEWKFDFTKSGLRIKTSYVWFTWETFKNGRVTVWFQHENGKNYRTTEELKDSQKFSIIAEMSRGVLSYAWQHAQLFRESFRSKDYPFEVYLELY